MSRPKHCWHQLPKIVPYHLFFFYENQVIQICRPHRLYRGQIRTMYRMNTHICKPKIANFSEWWLRYLRWMPLTLTDDKSTLVLIMAWCHQATSHYLSQCWPRSMSPNGVTRPQWVNSLSADGCGRDFKYVYFKLYGLVYLVITWTSVTKVPQCDMVLLKHCDAI